jgi:hypothetical protein
MLGVIYNIHRNELSKTDGINKQVTARLELTTAEKAPGQAHQHLAGTVTTYS